VGLLARKRGKRGKRVYFGMITLFCEPSQIILTFFPQLMMTSNEDQRKYERREREQEESSSRLDLIIKFLSLE